MMTEEEKILKKDVENAKEASKKDVKDIKGTVNSFNNGTVTVKEKPYYYDAYKTDGDIKKEFGDMMGDLKQFNMKLKKELKQEEPTKINLEQEKIK